MMGHGFVGSMKTGIRKKRIKISKSNVIALVLEMVWRNIEQQLVNIWYFLPLPKT